MSLLSFNLPLAAFLPFAAAPIAAWATRYNRLASAWVAGLTTLLTLAILFPSMHAIFAGETIIQQWSWLPDIGFNIAFRLDGLALLFALLILLIGLLIWVIRSFGGYPDAVAFSVLLLNLSAPFIDYYTQPRTYGHKSSNRGVS